MVLVCDDRLGIPLDFSLGLLQNGIKIYFGNAFLLFFVPIDLILNHIHVSIPITDAILFVSRIFLVKCVGSENDSQSNYKQKKHENDLKPLI